jgi:hypothetical protein
MVKPRKINIGLILIVILLSFGCTKLLFENPIPNEGEIVQVLPKYFKGKFLKKGENTYYDIKRFNDKHCLVYSSEWIHKDSIDALIDHLKNDSTYAEFKDSKLIIHEKDTSQIINLSLENNLYLSEKEPVYEINLDEGYFIDDFKELHKKKALLKYYKNKYYLNIGDTEEYWFGVWMEKIDDSLLIRNSFIADTAFADNLTYYNKLTSFEKIAKKTYLVNPSDTELLVTLKEPLLFNEEIWIKVDERDHLNWIWQLIGIVIVILFITLIAVRKQKNNRTTH